MQFTKAEDYGLHGIMYLADQPNGKVTPLSEISDAQQVPEKFLAKIFQSLSKTGLVKSHRGVKGGFSMGKPADRITVKEVLESIQGPYYISKCLADASICKQSGDCSVRRLLQMTQDRILEVFEGNTISDLVIWGKKDSLPTS
ncbi:MAG: Rrf2 family transcriptional regulator [candidate division Zixibacteria bacterium]|nr:Rrf2 family transcriptional regulator [candidate division Zixibacteria bacterium]MBU1470616.1 Rrf2 family transcriptional regulator [candidate division Zixibacteria bacterium]MBU2624317.1 Rrf2 family transcriptional regulator [candidate division Zixibacteria bacterium]